MVRHMSLVERVALSPAVEALAGQPRYDMYMHDVTPEQWIGMFDVDFDNKQHLFKTAQLTRYIAKMDSASPADAYAAWIAGLVHDAPEAVIGDKNHNHKTAADDEAEISTLSKLVRDKQLYLTPDELEIALTVMADKNAGPVTEPGIIFDLSERVGYLLSAFTSWDAVEAGVVMSDVQREKVRWLGSNVMSNTYELVYDYAQAGRQSALHVIQERSQTVKDIMNQASEPMSKALHLIYYHEAGLDHKVEKLYSGLHSAQLLANSVVVESVAA